ncbi:hypothetical protein [Dyella sp. 2HG41-7]|uniref:hypothetical protein n=1 Tax=Dyella sp. 2HG41-7 TaxID=2883239 RepID=UPI001F24D582|nr:hypothetical protein [Dyella sp. 2HG41-7]
MLRKLLLAISSRPPISVEQNPAKRHDAVMVPGPGICNFIGMEYYAGILNRTFLVCGFRSSVCGVRIRGVISNPLYLPPAQAVDPMAYVDQGLLARYTDVTLESMDLVSLDDANFRYTRADIESISLDMQPKWGMGNVLYSGRVLMKLKESKAREFILLGLQDVQQVIDQLASFN